MVQAEFTDDPRSEPSPQISGRSRNTRARSTGLGIGLAPPEWDGLLKALIEARIPQADLAAAGLIDRTGAGRTGFYDRFRGRVMFTITDLAQARRRIRRPRTRRGDAQVFKFAGYPAIQEGSDAVRVGSRPRGGHTDEDRHGGGRVFRRHRAASSRASHTVATLGTALTPDHIQVLRRFASKVVLAFDPDPAGVRAALRGLDLFVNSGIRREGRHAAGRGRSRYVSSAKKGRRRSCGWKSGRRVLLDFALEHSLNTAEASTIEGRIRSVDEVLRILQKSEHPIEREERIRIVAERLGINQQRLIERYPALMSQESRRHGRSPKPAGTRGRP